MEKILKFQLELWLKPAGNNPEIHILSERICQKNYILRKETTSSGKHSS
jgi:hypothetical protein